MLLEYFLNGYEDVPITPITFSFYIPHVLHFYCQIFIFYNLLGSFLDHILSPVVAVSTNIRVPLSLSRVMMSGLLLGMVLSVCTC